MRGQVCVFQQLFDGAGITPADAGTSTAVTAKSIVAEDHPRGCGDKSLHLDAITDDAMITPADAGTRLNWAGSCVYPEDHPRGCGDKNRHPACRVQPLGSPPRMRGQGNAHPRKANGNGITPADAGTRNSWTTKMSQHGDHPRGCGDKTACSL